jgi:dihydroorotate dehydrogenase (fumarate)
METRVGKMNLLSCIYNASGCRCTTLEELQDLEKSQAAAILTKSCTFEPRNGNAGKRYWDNDEMSINANGLANLGYQFYKDVKLNRESKPYIVSVAGLTLQDNLTILNELKDSKTIDSIEINLSCPNISGKPQIAYDEDAMSSYLRKIFDIEYNNISIGIKLSPYFDHEQFVGVSEILNQYKPDYVTCINSLGCGLVIDTLLETSVISPNQGHGGIGGSIIYPIAIANVHKFRQLLDHSIDVVGCGGVVSGKDVFGHILAGASAVQIGTLFQKKGIDVFSRLNDELCDIMINKGYKNISDFKNTLIIK